MVGYEGRRRTHEEEKAAHQKITPTYHVVTWKQFLQELRLLMLHCFDDELVIIGDVEDAATGPGVGQLP